MTIDYFTVGVNATKAVIVNQLAIEDILHEEDEMFAAEDAYSYERDMWGDDAA